MLAEAGVVDAGAAGLVEIVRGIAAALAGEPLPELAPPGRARRRRSTSMHQELSRYRYCTVFVVEGDGLDAGELERELEPLGDSLLVVGDPTRAEGARPHRRPGPRALARRRARRRSPASRSRTCTPRRIERERAAAARRARRSGRACALVAVAAGAGNRAAAREPRRRVVDGGRTMNPSTAEILAAVEADAAPRGDRSCPNDRERRAGRRARRGRARRSRCSWSRPRRCRRASRRRSPSTPALPADANAEAMAAPRRGRDRRGHDRLARRRDQRRSRSARAPGSGSPTALPVAGGESFDEVARARRRAAARRAARDPDVPDGRGAASRSRRCSPSSRGASRARARGARGRPAELPALPRCGIAAEGVRAFTALAS